MWLHLAIGLIELLAICSYPAWLDVQKAKARSVSVSLHQRGTNLG